jgi:hypothetical protein
MHESLPVVPSVPGKAHAWGGEELLGPYATCQRLAERSVSAFLLRADGYVHTDARITA